MSDLSNTFQNLPFLKKIPENWNIKIFTDVFSDITGGNPKIKTNNYLKTGELPIIDQGNQLIAGYTNNLQAQCKSPIPAIIFGDHTKKIKYIDFPFALGADGVKVLKLKIKSDYKFLYYFLTSLNLPEAGYNRHFKYLKQTTIPLPPMETQKKIVNILDKAQELIDKRKQQIDLMDSLVQSLFYDMFGDPVLNPMGWEEKNISEIIKEKTQNGLYLSQEHYSSEGIQMVHMSDAFYDMVPLGEMKRVKLNSNDITKYKLEPNDLILARRSLNYEGAAKPCRVPKTISESIVYESSLIRLRPDNSKILTIYLYYYLKDERIRKAFIYKHITKSTISGINNKALNMIKIINPPITLQNNFAEKVEKIEIQKQKMQKSLKDLEQNFSSLMQRAFKGEI
jgi:type I restriction enzyme S subunit